METNFLKLYLDANKTLAKTLVVKSQASIDLINDYIKLIYGIGAVDLYDPTSWKYYLNISGEYHISDQQMLIASLDTLEEIVFSKATLAIHLETAKAYQYGTRYYYSLLNQYPEQEQLILGILYPCDINTAVVAEEGTILSYPSYLVEPQELTLIDELSDHIKRYLIRWNVQAFGLSDNLYNAAQHGILYLNILPKLLNLRLQRCHTYQVHSFHIREYLASHNGLDRYLPFLTLKQALYLYRNIRYLERNSGTVEQFKELVDHLLTERRIPLNEFSVRQLSSFDDIYYNELSIRRKAVNPQYNVPEKAYFPVEELYNKELPLVYGNIEYLDHHQAAITHKLQTSPSSVLQTKDLESSMIDYSDSIPDTLESVLLHLWAQLANKGLYTAIINFKDPKTLINYQLSAEDTFIYMLYVSCQSIGLNIETLPNYINIKQRRLILPTTLELTNITDPRYTLLPIAERLLSNQPNLGLIQSIPSFFDIGYTIYQEAFYHWMLLSNTHHMERRGYIQGMVHMLYDIEYLQLSSGQQPMDEWLFNHNLPVYEFDATQANELVTALFKAATGLSTDDTRLLKNIQSALISILSQLSSYSIQFIKEINASRIIPIGWAAIRVGRSYGVLKHNHYNEVNVRVVDVAGRGTMTYKSETSFLNELHTTDQRLTSLISVPVGAVTTTVQSVQQAYEAYFPAYEITVENEADPVVLGYDNYVALTDEQKQLVFTLYN